MNKPAYKGKNIRVREDAHKLATNHCGKKIVLGEFVSEAIEEKVQREGVPTLDRQDPKITDISLMTDGSVSTCVTWRLKKKRNDDTKNTSLQLHYY